MTPYPIEELQTRNDSDDEQERTRKIFEDLKGKANQGKKLSEHEKNFFCLGVSISLLDDGCIEDYLCCDNYKFVGLYLVYAFDLTGGSIYKKLKNMQEYKPSSTEVNFDLKYLLSTGENWESFILKTNHSEKWSQEVASEARKEIRNLNNQPEFLNDPFSKGSFRYYYKWIGIILKFKWFYIVGLEIFETLNISDNEFTLNGETIEFNEYSLIHIFNRHFAEALKQYQSDKSYHSEDFDPRKLCEQLKEIITTFDNSNLLNGKRIDKIGFQFNGKDYFIWTSVQTKSMRGVGNVQYRRLETFYPLENSDELNKLKSDSNLIQINNELSLYVPN